MVRKRVAGRFVRESVTSEETAEKKAAMPGAPRPKYCRSYTRKRMAEALPMIAEVFLEEAKKGSIQHAKVLMKLSGLEGKDVSKPTKRRGKGVARRLLEELKREPRREVLRLGKGDGGAVPGV